MKFAHKLLVLAVLLVPTAAVAEDAPADLAKQVVALSVVPGIDARLAGMVNNAVGKQPAGKQAEARTKLTAAAADVRTALLKIFVDYYAKDFSAAELGQLKTFFEAPLGKKLVAADVNKPAEVDSQIAQQFMKLVVAINSLN